MKNLVATFVTALVGAAAGVGYATPAETQVNDRQESLLLIGPVEAVNSTHTMASILGQKVLIGSSDPVAVGTTVAVYGNSLADGSIAALKIEAQGSYVPGATPILLTGTVQAVQPSVGRVVVGGLTVDLTSMMAGGAMSPVLGSKLQITGTQPVNHGLVVVNGISGGGLTANGISGGGRVSTNGISGGGKDSTSGISGGGFTANGISGGGRVSTNGISGGGKVSTSGISGGGFTANGISGGGRVSTDGISGGGRITTAGISGGGLN